MKKVALHNLGCKVNAYETDAMQQLLEENGYEIVPFEEGADVYIINTCTVTNIADRKSRQMIHKAKKMNPHAVVVAAGCYAQVAGENKRIDECIDILVGNNHKIDIVTALKAYEEEQKKEQLSAINEKGIAYETLSIAHTGKNTRAYIKVQDGCNQFCSYCIIPYARGRVRSRSKEDVLKEVKTLAKNGYKEVVLTGIHVSSYGTDLSEEETLLTLLQAIHKIDGIERIRLSSLEPRIVTREFAESIGKLHKLCPHFHLSLQSGCDETLKRMNRHYSTNEYYKACELLREVYDHPAITTDIITGFPGETEEEFAQTVEFVKKVNFYETHVFKYSKREGTRAAVMDNQLTEAVKGARSKVLLDLDAKNSLAFREYYMGKEVEILVEEDMQFQGEVYQIGHTKEYVRVAIKENKNISNTLVHGIVSGFLQDDVLLIGK